MIDSLEKLRAAMAAYGAKRLYAKLLSPNDNTKNQIYLGGDFSVLNILPFEAVYTDGSDLAGSVRDRAKAGINFYWIDEAGPEKAAHAQLILYPKYPEVRLSGLLRGCSRAPSDIIRVRDEGRVLVLGITPDGSILGFAASADHPVARELANQQADFHQTGVFLEIPIRREEETDTRDLLLAALRWIYEKHWIPSQKLDSDGIPQPYSAPNGGGYTLEAELGVTPNGYAEPDYLGWEIKQYAVNNFETYRPKSPVTLMTPEPTGGIYRDQGAEAFVRQFGYPDTQGRPDRMNFGGVHACGKDFHARTGLKMIVEGFDPATGKITNMNGRLALVSRSDEIAADWNFAGLMSHWNRKHAQAAYVPSLSRKPPPEYRYAPKALLCEKTDFALFLAGMASGAVYYDPGIKVENISTTAPKTKKRSQFRVKHIGLDDLYQRTETLSLTS